MTSSAVDSAVNESMRSCWVQCKRRIASRKGTSVSQSPFLAIVCFFLFLNFITAFLFQARISKLELLVDSLRRSEKKQSKINSRVNVNRDRILSVDAFLESIDHRIRQLEWRLNETRMAVLRELSRCYTQFDRIHRRIDQIDGRINRIDARNDFTFNRKG